MYVYFRHLSTLPETKLVQLELKELKQQAELHGNSKTLKL